MNFPQTDDEVRGILEVAASEECEVCIDKFEPMPWGAVAQFSMDGVAADPEDIMSDGETTVIFVGEDDFILSNYIKIELESQNDNEEEARPEMIMVGIQSQAETNDEDYQASYSGHVYMLAKDGDRDAWEKAAEKEQDKTMRMCINDTFKLVDDMISSASDGALKGMMDEQRVRDIMRRLAAAA